MLHSLSVRNLVLIDQLDLTFDGGLCVLTGETGAGKSILLDALGLALGGRSEARLLRPGASQASVTATFDLPADHAARDLMTTHGLEPSEDGLLLRRILGADGRSRAFVDDQPASVGLLRALGGALVEIQGQFEQHGLLDARRHRTLLDAYGGLADRRAETDRGWTAWRRAVEEAAEAERALAETRAEETRVREALDELEGLDPQPGEMTALEEQRARLMHREQLVEALNAAMATLGAENAGGAERGGAERALATARRHLASVAAKAGGGLDEPLAALDRAAAELAEATAGIEAFSADLDLEPEALARIEERYFAFKDLARKHGVEAEALADLRAELAERLATLDAGSERLASLDQAATAARAAYLAAAECLSAARAEAAEALDRPVMAELPPLKLEKARFATRVERLTEERAWGPEGIDQVRFEASTNPGMPLGPIGRIASGGELARFLLAIKVVLAGLGPTVTLVFDEVDSGVGGAAADAVGERLARLARDRQILVVTHSPQVAARATHHWRVSKEPDGEGAVTRVRHLEAGERREEIARMLSGAEVTDEARAAAGRLMGAA